MAYVLTNGKYYIKMSSIGKILKTDNVEETRIYLTTEKAKQRLEKTPGRTSGYYIYDLELKLKYKISDGRIKFPKKVRKKIYEDADGRCALCGKKITYRSMTLDHIKPLAMGGADSVENLQCSCEACNLFKGSVLPDDFMERITRIFLYQMEKKTGNSLKWKIVHKLLENII